MFQNPWKKLISRRSKAYLIIAAVIAAAVMFVVPSCISYFLVSDKETSVQVNNLNRFFSTCEKDIMAAVGIIVDNDITKNLTHLHRMNAGGTKYYLLEKENITAMIKTVTVGTYSDLILINKYGVIVYTMVNDDIFGKDVKGSLLGTPVYTCFVNSRGQRVHVEDFSVFMQDNSLNMYFSMLDIKDEHARGVFIMQINSSIIEKLIGEKSEVVGRDGNYRITPDKERLFTRCPFFEKIDMVGENTTWKKVLRYKEKKYLYSPLRFEDLSWIVLTPL